MQRLLLLATVIFATATVTPAAPPADASAPVALGTRATAWGELPVYAEPARIDWLARAIPYDALNGVAVLDVQFNRKGEIQASAIVESSGDRRVDAAFLRAFRHARLEREAPAGLPHAYVVRYTAAYWTPDPISTALQVNPPASPKLSVFSWRELETPPVEITLERERFQVFAPRR